MRTLVRTLTAVGVATLVAGLIAVPQKAEAVASYNITLCLNSLTSCNLALTATSPISNTSLDLSGEYGKVEVSANASLGRIGSVSSVEGWSSFFAPNRPEAYAFVAAEVSICSEAETAFCVPPAFPTEIPWPNMQFDFILTQENGSAVAAATVVADGATLFNRVETAGDGVARNDGSLRVAPLAGGTGVFTSPGSPGTYNLTMNVFTQAGCGGICNASSDAGSSVKFIAGEPAFVGVPEGFTVFAPDLNVANNVWTDPLAQAQVPVPAAGLLLPLALGALIGFRRRAHGNGGSAR